MLSGKDLGRAIEQAINKKLSSGAVKTKTEIARHFKVRLPSMYDWIKKGSISKEKLPELWAYFSDVVGPEHWGLHSFNIPAAYHEPSRREGSKAGESVSIYESSRRFSAERRAVIEFFMLEDGAPPPEWVDSDARAWAISLETKAREWVERDKSSTKKTSA